jgi:hypothetical protein
MAEYYPLLAKAVAGLQNSTPEARRVIYERARKALIAQLQNLQPPVPDADIARETQALDMAMARIEAELTAPNGSAGKAPRVEPRPAAAPRAVPPNLENSRARSFTRPPAAAPRPNGAAPGMGPPRARAGEAEDRTTETRAPEVQPDESPSNQRVEPRLRPEPIRAEVARPYAPQPETDDVPQSRRLWIVVGVVIIVVAMVAAAAWKLRDRPEDFAAFKSAVPSQTDQGGGKIVARIGGPAPQQPSPNPPAASPTPAAASTTAQATAPTQTQLAPAPAPKTANSDTSVPVAYRAALLVEAPEESNKVKTYVGTVIWRLENVSSDSGQPPGTAVRADIDIPDDKLKASLEIQKNTDPGLSASHTITIVFTIAPDSPTGGIKQISLPQLRSEDSPNGEALRGSLVPIMDNSFLIGLNRGDAEAANIDLIKQREWFDIPILLANGRVAKLTFEKNASGDRAVQDALASWQAQQ